MARAAAAVRALGGGHARAGAGERPGGAAAALGAQVVEAPAIRIEPRPAAEVDPVVERIGDYSLVCLTSPNGAALLFEALARTGRDARALAGATVAAIGPGTAAELRRHGVRADVVPPRSIAESLCGSAGRRARGGPPGARGPRGRGTRRAARRARRAEPRSACWRSTTPSPSRSSGRPGRRGAGLRDVHVELHRALLHGERVASGWSAGGVDRPGHERDRPETLALEVHVEAERHDIDGLVDALVGDAAAR